MSPSFLTPLHVLIIAECSSCSWHTTRFGYEMSFSSSESYVGVCMHGRGVQADILTLFVVFHSALVVMAALQVHETRAALVLDASANWTTNYVVRIVVLGVHRLLTACNTGWRRPRDLVADRPSFPHRFTRHYWSLLARHDLLRERALS